MKTIASLDNPTLLNIFNRLPLTHLKTAGRVCTRWYAFRTKSAAKRRDLDLWLGTRPMVPSGAPPNIERAIPFWEHLVHDDGTEMYPKVTRKAQSFDALQLEELSLDFAQFLANVMPKISNLTVVIDNGESSSNIDPLIHLLKSWNLTTLSINAIYDRSKFIPDEGESFGAHARLLLTINSELASLKSLEFYYNGSLIKLRPNVILSVDLPILGQLEQFSILTADPAEALIQSTEHFGQANDQLKQIWISSFTLDTRYLLSLRHELAHKFAHLFIAFPALNHGQFTSICARFLHLTTLELMVPLPNVSRDALFVPLESMTQLVYLKLGISDGNILKNFVPIENAKQTKLSTLKVFVLKFAYSPRLSTHGILHDMGLHLLMPNLQVFQLDRAPQPCEECVATGMVTESESEWYESVCLYDTLNYIRTECTKLRLLNTTQPNVIWNLNDF